MALGPTVRRNLGRLEQPAAETYRQLFFNVDHFAEIVVSWVPHVRRVLEIGCGDGAVADRITAGYPQAEYLGIDVASQPGRRFTGDTTRASFVSCSSSVLRASNPAPYDLVLVVDVLHHIPDDQDRVGVLADAAALCGPGGTIVVKEWERTGSLAYGAGWAADRYISGDAQVRYMTRGELFDLMERGAPDLNRVLTTTVRPWRCNVVHALRS